ncbi:MAG: outer membrane beta-barrel protein [Desulfobulbus sp.]
MKKVLSVMAVSAFVMTAGVAFAGGPGKAMDAACPEACQQQIDDLQSSQAQQNEELSAHQKQLENHEGRITDLEKAFDDAWYARIGVRIAWTTQDLYDDYANETDSDTGFGAAIAFGREFSMYQAPGKFRAELELAYQGADFDDFTPTTGIRVTDGEYKLTTVMVNGYYELPVYDAFSVYAMAGVGYAKYDAEWTDGVFGKADESDNVFAYKAGLGVTYNFTDDMAADLGYEYLGVADTDIADSINGHNIVASFRYKF